MSKNAKQLPRETTTQWLHVMDLDWAQWERRIAQEIDLPNFGFDQEQKSKISDALLLLTRYERPAEKSYEAQRKLRTIKAQFEKMNLPDSELLRADSPIEPSDFLMSLDFECVAHLFRCAMQDTVAEFHRGKSVPERIGCYLSQLRKNLGTFDLPRTEAMSIWFIAEVFEGAGVSTKVTHTRPTASGEGNENISVFEEFVFHHIMPELGSDDAARKVLQRRSDEAKIKLSI